MRRVMSFALCSATVFLYCLLLSACPNGNASELLRSYDDPFDDTPVAVSYAKEYKVFLSWRKDSVADEYILLRADDDGKYSFMEIDIACCFAFMLVERGER